VSKPGVSKRLVRSILRSLRDSVGESAFDAVKRQLPAEQAAILVAPREDWIALELWQPLLAAFEKRCGDLSHWQLVRQATRLAMAVAISKGWSAFLADVTPDQLLERADTFWKMSYNAGTLVVRERKPRRVLLELDGWRDPPAPVGAMVAEACAVFLARLGERAPRAIDRVSDGRQEIEVTW
jgi:hypothetical protein